MSFWDPKTAYAISMGLAGAIRRIARQQELTNALRAELEAYTGHEVGVVPDDTRPGTSDVDFLLVLAGELEAGSVRLGMRNRGVWELRQQVERLNAGGDVSRETFGEHIGKLSRSELVRIARERKGTAGSE